MTSVDPKPIVKIDLLQFNVFTYPSQHNWVYDCCNSLSVCSLTDALRLKLLLWTGRCLQCVCLPYSQQFHCSAYFPPNIFRCRVVATASEHALSEMLWWWSDDFAQLDIWRVACLPCNLATQPFLTSIG